MGWQDAPVVSGGGEAWKAAPIVGGTKPDAGPTETPGMMLDPAMAGGMPSGMPLTPMIPPGKPFDQMTQAEKNERYKMVGMGFAGGSIGGGLPKAAGEAAGAIADMGRGVAKPLVEGVGRTVNTVAGRTAKEGAEALRGSEAARAAEVAEQHQADAAVYKQKLDAIEKAQSDLSKQPATAEARAHSQALRHAPFAEEQSRVLESIRSRVRGRESEYQEAGASVEQAKKLAAQDEGKIVDAENAVGSLEKELLAQPTISAEKFGEKVRKIAETIHDKYTKIRSEQSGYKEAIEGAGNYQRVSTKEMIDQIDEQMKGIRNPELERVLGTARELLQTDGRQALTLKSADSLRGYLDKIIRSKMIGEMKVDRETLHFVGQLRKTLVKTATDSWQPYREALGRWRTLSRPLDVVERKGALKRTLDTDPVSTDYALTEAQVVGEVLNKARSGNPVFTRLISESPELRDSARLYFTKDLFGKEAVPSDASLRTWLKTNETPLRQLGLYDEFRDIRVAKQTAARSVEEAKGESKMSAAQVKESAQKERDIADKLGQERKLRDKEKSRIGDSAKSVTPPEDLMAASQKRAAEAGRRLESQKGDASSQLARKESGSDRYRQFETQINVARPQEVAGQTRAFVKKLRDDKLIDDKKYGELLREVQSVEDKYKDTTELRAKLKRIGWTAAGLLGAGVGARQVSGMLGH